jgi:hypothetical protein
VDAPRAFARGGMSLLDQKGSVRLVKARPTSAAGESPPVQIMVPSFDLLDHILLVARIEELDPAALVALNLPPEA